MKTYKYLSDTVVAVIDEDGISRMSMLASALPEGTAIEPADLPDPREAIRAQIDTLEKTSLLPRVTREFMLLSFASTAAGMGVDPMTNVGYAKVKELDDQIAALRAQL